MQVTLEAHPATEVALVDSFGDPFPYRVRVDQAELGYHTSSRDLLGLQTLSVPEGLDLRTADWKAEGWSNRDHPLLLDRPDDLGQDSWIGTEVIRRHLVVRTGLVRIPGERPLAVGFCDEEGNFFAERADLEGSSTLLPPGAYWYGPEEELLTLAWSVKPNDWTGRRKVLPSEVRHPLVNVEAGEVVVLPPIDRDEPGFRLSFDVRTFLPEHLFVDFGDDPEGARAPRGMLPTALEVDDAVELVLDPAVGVPTWAMACIARVDSRGLRTPLWFEPSFDGAALHIDPGWITFEGGPPPDGTTLTLVRDDDGSERGSVFDTRTIAAFLEGTDRLEVPPGSYTIRDSRNPRIRRELVVQPGEAKLYSLTHPNGQD